LLIELQRSKLYADHVSLPAADCLLPAPLHGMLPAMKNATRGVRDAVTSKTAKDALAGTGLFGAGEITGACVLGCLALWLALALVIMLVWVLVALLAAALPL
jgi:hypothetical protein